MWSTIHINCDLGEGGGFDDQLMSYISACNIACGGHYGDRQTVEETIALAVQNGVQIGAHPAYPDKANFGRRSLGIPIEELTDTIGQQLILVKTEAEKQGHRLHHVKPHGALYNDLVQDRKKAEAMIRTILEIDPSLILLVPPKSIIKALAEGKLKCWIEGFADRNYNPDYTLVSRSEPEAVLKDKNEVLKRVLSIAKKGRIIARDGVELKADFRTLCLHSDTENSLQILRYLHQELKERQIGIEK